MTTESTGSAHSKAKHFLGFARIPLQYLDFTPALRTNHREESAKIKLRLIHVFKLEGCRRFDEENFIDAKIDADTLRIALEDKNLTSEQFQNRTHNALSDPTKIPHLEFHRTIPCFNGLHRIRAADEFLDNNDKWWIVRLYAAEGCIQTLRRPIRADSSRDCSQP